MSTTENNELYATALRLYQHPRGINVWREFHCLCLRRIWDYIPEQKCKDIIAVVESYLVGNRELIELEANFKIANCYSDIAWDRVMSLYIKEKNDWPITEEVDLAFVLFESWSSVSLCTSPTLQPHNTPQTFSIPIWYCARKNLAEKGIDLSDPSSLVYMKECDRIKIIEKEAHACILKRLLQTHGLQHIFL
jgi:hypothetical protein